MKPGAPSIVADVSGQLDIQQQDSPYTKRISRGGQHSKKVLFYSGECSRPKQVAFIGIFSSVSKVSWVSRFKLRFKLHLALACS